MKPGIVFRTFLFISTFLLCAGALHGQDSNALLDLLVKKKLITEKEANEVRTELIKDTKATSTGKWKLSTPITELELYGDARLRYEIRNGETQSDDTQQRNRERYRLRLGLRGILADDWFFGVRLRQARIRDPRTSLLLTIPRRTQGEAVDLLQKEATASTLARLTSATKDFTISL